MGAMSLSGSIERWLAPSLAIASIVAAAPATAQSVADFYKGKTVNVTVAAAAGGGHDTYSRLVLPVVRQHLPGTPAFVVQNVGGAGGARAAHLMFNVAPRDGSAIGLLLQGMALSARIESTGVSYDPGKFSFLGGADNVRTGIVVRTRTGVTSMEQARTREVVLGSTGTDSESYVVPMLANAILGTRFKVLTSYRGMSDIYLAIDRGEVDGFVAAVGAVKLFRPQWIKDNEVKLLAAIAFDKAADFPDAPLLHAMPSNPVDQNVLALFAANGVMGRAWLAPPDVPADRLAALRDAFAKALADPMLAAEAGKRRMDWEPVTWQELQAALERVARADAAVIGRLKSMLPKKN